MPAAAPRPRPQRKADALAMLTAPAADAWVATAGDDGPYLVPLSVAWVDERIVLAAERTSRTVRNLVASGSARLGLGPTRDVVLVDAVLQEIYDAAGAGAVADAYAAQADWDPRQAGDGFGYLVLRPVRIQAWRESNEIAGRTLMRDGRWVV